MKGTLAQPQLIHYLPILTTIVSVPFFLALVHRYRTKKRGAHLLWWAAGVCCYGIGTALESTITLFGNSVLLSKLWFIAGALLGGFPLAQGTVYLLMRRKTANILTALTIPIVVAAVICVVMSPVDIGRMQPARPSGDLLEWQWIRSAFGRSINLYSVIFLVGGAVLSAIRFGHYQTTRHRAIGNALIAFGALLPAIGGVLTKVLGMVEALYVGEFVGLCMIWLGYAFCIRRRNGASDDANDLTAVRSVLHTPRVVRANS
ncbi:MAG: hypothetical protein H6819_00685 [Phycisphaerales bacterium]|nr:hypothetical protein [Phycisphaerales bacterium]MCB9857276.1 hypothetical protein [Phycisphaerales bacterium]MCB9863010.1 hypothetical protein [Phycisphaerales bacterium]